LDFEIDLKLRPLGKKVGKFSIGETKDGVQWHAAGNPWNEEDAIYDILPRMRSEWLQGHCKKITA
jgi:hypothetical protein